MHWYYVSNYFKNKKRDKVPYQVSDSSPSPVIIIKIIALRLCCGGGQHSFYAQHSVFNTMNAVLLSAEKFSLPFLSVKDSASYRGVGV